MHVVQKTQIQKKQYMKVKYLSVHYQCSLVGTFAPENDKVIYGLTHPINTFNILSVEVRYHKSTFIEIIFWISALFSVSHMSSCSVSLSSEFQSAMLNVNMSCEFSHQWKSHTITITLVVHFKQERRECRQETMCSLPLIIFSALSLGGERQTQSYL